MTKNHPWDAVIFDYGRVLTHGPTPEEAERFSELTGVSDFTAFFDIYGATRDAYDCGFCDYREHWSRFCEVAGVWLTPQQVEELARLELEVWTRENPETLVLAREVRNAGIKTAVLSNMPHDLLAEVSGKFPWLDAFEVKTWSCELGVVKPDPTIYHACLDALGCKASRALFFDDRPRNVEGAIKVGMQAHVFLSPQQARAILEQGLA